MTAKDHFAAHVGLDWADKSHDVCVQFKNGDRIDVVIAGNNVAIFLDRQPFAAEFGMGTNLRRHPHGLGDCRFKQNDLYAAQIVYDVAALLIPLCYERRAAFE